MDAHFHVRHFSLREADALLPTLQKAFVRARAIRAELVPVQQKLGQLGLPTAPEELEVDLAQPAEVRDLQARGRDLAQDLLAALREVSQLGIEVKAADGLCDFRTRLAGRTVYLCWKFGEERITHYHDLASGFSGRKPLPEGAEFVGELLH